MSGTADMTSPALEQLLARAVQEGVFPGAVAAFGTLGEGRSAPTRERYACAGSLAPGEAAVTLSAVYDLASLTKPFVAAAALRLAQRGALDLHEPLFHLLPELEETPAGESTLALLLSHRAGLASYARLFEELRATPGSEEARRFIVGEAARRVDPSSAPSRSVYSDLGYIVAGEALARRAAQPLAAVVGSEVTDPLGIAREVFYAAALSASRLASLRERVAPTEQCPQRGRLLRGEVHDENAHALGGIAGHAGLFGTARGVLRFGFALLSALEGRSTWLDQAIARWALRARGVGFVIGWDTKSAEGSSAGSLFSARSFGHLGFSGTSIWCDPARRLCAVLLSNRVHPTRENIAIRDFRPHFHDAVVELARELAR